MKVNLPHSDDIGVPDQDDNLEIKIIKYVNENISRSIKEVNLIGYKELSLLFPYWFYDDVENSMKLLKAVLRPFGYKTKLKLKNGKERVYISWH